MVIFASQLIALNVDPVVFCPEFDAVVPADLLYVSVPSPKGWNENVCV